MKYILSLLIVIGCVACNNKRLARKTVVLSPVTVSGKSVPPNIYRGSRTRVWDVIHTRARLSFNLQDKTAQGRAWIDIHPYFYSTDTLQLDAKGMQIDSVLLISDSLHSPLKYTYADDVLTIRFGKAYTTKDSIRLCIQYKAMPYGKPNTGGSAAIGEDRGLYFINTDHSIPNKPTQIWTQGETESNSRWLPTIDAPNERFTTQLELIVPDSFVTLSNGSATGHVNWGNGLRMDIWRMEKRIQTYAVMFAIGNFAIVKDEWKRREVSYYVELEYEPYARAIFKNTPEMIEYYSKITGVPYPWNKYSQVIVRDYVSGAMENTTASLFGEFMNQNARENADNDNEDVVSHELFHQWFGDYVTAESWSNLTLNESFATYAEQLWRKNKYGKVSADELAFEGLWNYMSVAQSKDPSLVRYKYADREEMFDRISYQKGAAILNYLHGLTGDDAFFKAMQLYLTQNALKPAEAAQWRLAVEEATGQDWNWFFNQWYYRGGHPELDIKYNYNDALGQLAMVVTQKQDSLYNLPLKAEVIYGTDKKEVDWKLTVRKDTFIYSYKNNIKPVIVPDSRYWLVGRITENKEPKEWLVEYKNSNDNILSKHYAIGSVRKKLDDTSAQAIFNLALEDKEASIRELVLIGMEQITLKKWQDKWKSNVAYLAANDGSNKVRAAAFNVLESWKISSSKEDMYVALADSSYMVAGAALGALHEIAKDTAYTIAKQMLSTDPRGSLQAAIWDIIAAKGNSDDIVLFEKQAPYFYGTKKISFAYSVSAYLLNVKDTIAFKRAITVQENLITTESIRPYRSAMAASLFQTASDYKEQLRNVRTNAEKATLKQKMDLLKPAFERIIKEEKDEKSKTQYRELLNTIYE